MCDDKWIEQKAKMAADSIVCMAKSVGYESLAYAESLIISIIKAALREDKRSI